MVNIGDAVIVALLRDGRVRVFEWPKIDGSGRAAWDAVCAMANTEGTEPDDIVRVRANYLEPNPATKAETGP